MRFVLSTNWCWATISGQYSTYQYDYNSNLKQVIDRQGRGSGTEGAAGDHIVLMLSCPFCKSLSWQAFQLLPIF
jgi:hypothetical protein